MSGLMVNGKSVLVEGVSIVNTNDNPLCSLTAGKDYKNRTSWPTQWILHKTIADDPEHVIPGAGVSGGPAKTAQMWRDSIGKILPYRNAGAHLITGEDGVVWNLADLVTADVFHATVSNIFSVGHETREAAGGGVQQAALDATVAVVLAGIEALGIQGQFHRPYKGHPFARMLNGGIDCIGVFGHRDNTEDRGEWDPGNILFSMLYAKGLEAFDFSVEQDKEVWANRQRDLIAKGYALVADGVPGPKTTAALRSEGYRGGVWALGKT